MTVTGAGLELEQPAGVNIGNLGTGTLTIADGGVVTGPIVIAANAGCDWNAEHRRGRGQSGGCTRHDHGAEPRFWRWAPARLNFNHTSDSYVFAPAISGNGTVNVLAGTTTLTGCQHL